MGVGYDARAVEFFQHAEFIGLQRLCPGNASAGEAQAQRVHGGLDPECAAPGHFLLQPGHAHNEVLRGVDHGRLDVDAEIPDEGRGLDVARYAVDAVGVAQHVLDVL